MAWVPTSAWACPLPLCTPSSTALRGEALPHWFPAPHPSEPPSGVPVEKGPPHPETPTYRPQPGPSALRLEKGALPLSWGQNGAQPPPKAHSSGAPAGLSSPCRSPHKRGPCLRSPAPGHPALGARDPPRGTPWGRGLARGGCPSVPRPSRCCPGSNLPLRFRWRLRPCPSAQPCRVLRAQEPGVDRRADGQTDAAEGTSGRRAAGEPGAPGPSAPHPTPHLGRSDAGAAHRRRRRPGLRVPRWRGDGVRGPRRAEAEAEAEAGRGALCGARGLRRAWGQEPVPCGLAARPRATRARGPCKLSTAAPGPWAPVLRGKVTRGLPVPRAAPVPGDRASVEQTGCGRPGSDVRSASWVANRPGTWEVRPGVTVGVWEFQGARGGGR